MNKTAVINIVGLTSDLLQRNMPFLLNWSSQKRSVSTISPVMPAVTCTAQSTYLTGKHPNEHGIVANGWMFKDECELKLWRQSNHLVQTPKIWDIAKAQNSKFTCANMFWWYNMNSSVDYCVTPRPQYLADGSKKPDCYSYPLHIRHQLQDELGTFPLFNFWGPKTTIKSSQWIANASKKVSQWFDPTMTLIYLPHLDYNLQRHGNGHHSVDKDLNEIDEVVKDLILFYESRQVEVVILSEYGITDVHNPIHINRALRENSLINIRTERGLEMMDIGTSRAVALADHQIAHIYIKNSKDLSIVANIVEQLPGVELVLDKQQQKEYHLNHNRSGDLVAVADKDSWFTYYYWLDDTKAPDYARTIDIHKKPGYDPLEMVFDPKKKLLIPRIVLKLLKKKLGFRTVMDVVPLDAYLIKGSHGRIHVEDENKPVFISSLNTPKTIEAIEVFDWLMKGIDP